MASQNEGIDEIVDKVLAGMLTDAGHAKDLGGDHAGALRLFEEAVRRDPSDVQARYNWGDALLATGRTRDAAEVLSLVVLAAPGNALAHYDLGRALYDLGRFEDAERHLRVAIGPDGRIDRGQDAPRVHAAMTLALCQEQRGATGAAIGTLEAARSLAVSILYNLGRLKLAVDDDVGAHACLAAAALVAPAAEEVRHLAGVALLHLGRHEEAEEHLAQATALDPECVEAWFDRGSNLARAGREGARECFEEVLRQEPIHAGAAEALRMDLGVVETF